MNDNKFKISLMRRDIYCNNGLLQSVSLNPGN